MAAHIEEIDDEELLSLYEAAKKLLDTSLQQRNQPNQKKIPMLKRKIDKIEQELKARSLWD